MKWDGEVEKKSPDKESDKHKDVDHYDRYRDHLIQEESNRQIEKEMEQGL